MKRKIIYIIIIIILVISGFFVYKSFEKKSVPLTDEEPLIEVEDNQINLGKVENGVYQNDTYGFSLALPNGMTATNFNEGEGTTILVQSTEMNTAGREFQMQIFISLFDEDIALTVARIKKDVQDLKMDEPIEIKTDGVATVAFYSTEGGEKHREIWFVHGGFLYQVLAKAVDDNTTGTVMDGWKWKN